MPYEVGEPGRRTGHRRRAGGGMNLRRVRITVTGINRYHGDRASAESIARLRIRILRRNSIQIEAQRLGGRRDGRSRILLRRDLHRLKSGWYLDGLVLAFSLLPMPDGMVLVPVLAPDDSSSLTERSSRGKSAPVLFPLQGTIIRSQEGPARTGRLYEIAGN